MAIRPRAVGDLVVTARRLALEETGLPGVFAVHLRPFADHRGRFERLFCLQELAEVGAWSGPIAQVDRSVTIGRGSVRGLHYQGSPAADRKLVLCLRGRVFDVAVDLRRDSPNRARWVGLTLGEGGAAGLLVPEGFAHGFQVLSDEAELLYLHSAPYTPTCEGGVSVHDPRLAIAWPLPVVNLSERDRNLPHLDDMSAESV